MADAALDFSFDGSWRSLRAWTVMRSRGIKDRSFQQNNYRSFSMARIAEAPTTNLDIVLSNDAPTKKWRTSVATDCTRPSQGIRGVTDQQRREMPFRLA